MRFRRLIPAALATVIAIAGTFAAAADEPASLPTLVEHYTPVRAALAADDLDGVKEHADALAKAGDRKLAAAARELAAAEDITAARAAFGDVSRALIAQVKGAEKKHDAALPVLHLFKCPMAKPYGEWLQVESGIANPYMGSRMPRCGSRTALLGGGGEPRRLLDDYLAVRKALAADSLYGVKEHAGILAVSGDRKLAAAARELASSKDITVARKAFGEVSRALIGQVEANEKRKKGKADLPALHLFKCPMASPYGQWLQEESTISNPYMGSRMPRCGSLVETLGGGGDAKSTGDASYVCPMHSGVTAEKPGSCPKCGMALRKKAE